MLINLVALIFSLIEITSSVKECKRHFSIRKNSIILTKNSLNNGAEFIHKQSVTKFSDCYALCCSNPDCTVAVFENKVHHKCFMFNCAKPNVCLFTDHSNYIAMMQVFDEAPSKIPSNPVSQTSMDKPVKSPVSIDAKLGENCGKLRKCGPENSMCTSGTCICQPQFIARHGKCVRSMCPKPELMFQCDDTNKMPFCVAIYDKCNGLSECGDGSDEKNCAVIKGRQNPNEETGESLEQFNDKSLSANAKKQLAKFNVSMNNYYRGSKISQNGQHKSTNLINQYKDTSPLAENQLLLLESKNSLPQQRYHGSSSSSGGRGSEASHHRSHNNNRDSKSKEDFIRQQQQRQQQQLYHKLKQESMPRISKLDEYYQTPSSSSRDKWNSDSYADYVGEQPMNSGGGSGVLDNLDGDWSTNGNVPGGGGSYSDGGSSSSYLDDPNYNFNYQKPRGRYISDNDYYLNKDMSGPVANSNAYQNSAPMSPSVAQHHYHHKSQDVPAETPHHQQTQSDYNHKTNKIFIKPSDTDKSIQASDLKNNKDSDDPNAVAPSPAESEYNTAIIALSLGLFITALMLITIAYKMRNWRKRLRRGAGGTKNRSLTTDEGDYLINGMYL